MKRSSRPMQEMRQLSSLLCCILLALGAPCLQAAPATQPGAPTTQPVDADAVRLRQIARLAWLSLHRQANVEASIDEAYKQRILDSADEFRQKLLDNIASSASGSSSFEKRADSLRSLWKEQSAKVNEVIRTDKVGARIAGQQIGRIKRETELIAGGKEKALKSFTGLSLTEEQRSKAETLLDETDRKNAKENVAFLDDEERMSTLLAARSELRKLLSEEQWGRWSDALAREEALRMIHASSTGPPPRSRTPGPAK